MVIKVLIGLGVVAVLLIAYLVLSMPKNIVITRSIVINAPAHKVFPYANNPKLMQEWNPFTEDDPYIVMSYSGPAEGVGASSAWDSKIKEVGVGQATIIEVESNVRVKVRLDFHKPFKGTNYGEYLLEPIGNATKFTWTIDESSFVPRLMCRFINLDKVLGDKFEKGLKKLKIISEKE